MQLLCQIRCLLGSLAYRIHLCTVPNSNSSSCMHDPASAQLLMISKLLHHQTLVALPANVYSNYRRACFSNVTSSNHNAEDLTLLRVVIILRHRAEELRGDHFADHGRHACMHLHGPASQWLRHCLPNAMSMLSWVLLVMDCMMRPAARSWEGCA